MQWCSVEDVVQLTQVLGWDFQDEKQTLMPSFIAATISEATLVVQALVKPNYNIEDINAYGQDNIPKAIVGLTKVTAVRILYTRRGLDSNERNSALIAMLDEQYNNWSLIVSSGLLRDNNDVLITTQSSAAYIAPSFNSKFALLYPNDRARTY